MDNFGSKILKIAKRFRLDSMTREYARPYSHWTFLVDTDAWQFWV